MQALAGKVAVVTGAASGIGLGIARTFAREGMHVVAADIDATRLAEEVGRLPRADGVVTAVPTDVRDLASVEALAQQAYDRHGAVHVLVNNAGVLARGATWDLELSDWERVLRVNLWGVIHGIKAFVPLMLQGGQEGHVVNVGSMASVVPHPTLGPYNASKHAVLGISEALAAELAAEGRIGVTLVMPGRVASRLGGGEPDPSVMDPDEVGAVVVRAIRGGELFAFTHPERLPEVASRFDRILGRTDR